MVDFNRRTTRDDDRGSRSSRDERPSRGRDDAPRGGRDEPRGSGSSSKFTYTPRTREQVEKRATAGASDFDKILKPHIKVWTPAKGENRVRILPATWPNPIHYGYDIYVHYGVGPDRQAYLDLQRMLDKPDPIDEERNILRRSGRASEQEIRDLNSSRRVLCYIIDRNHEEEGVQAWTMAQTVDQSISAVSVDQDTKEVLNIDDPDEGYDVSFRKDGEKLQTKYTGISISRRPSRLGKSEWLDFAIDNPLPDQLQFYSYEEIAKEFGGGGVHRERDEGRQERGESDDRGRDDGRREDSDRGRDRGVRDAAPEESRDDSRRGARNDRSREEQALDYDTVMQMTFDEMQALCESNSKLSTIVPDESKDDDELREWICEDLKLEKPTAREQVQTTRRSAAAPAAEPPEDKLAEMRAARGRR